MTHCIHLKMFKILKINLFGAKEAIKSDNIHKTTVKFFILLRTLSNIMSVITL